MSGKRLLRYAVALATIFLVQSIGWAGKSYGGSSFSSSSRSSSSYSSGSSRNYGSSSFGPSSRPSYSSPRSYNSGSFGSSTRSQGKTYGSGSFSAVPSQPSSRTYNNNSFSTRTQPSGRTYSTVPNYGGRVVVQHNYTYYHHYDSGPPLWYYMSPWRPAYSYNYGASPVYVDGGVSWLGIFITLVICVGALAVIVAMIRS